MNKTNTKKFFSLLLAVLMTASTFLLLAGCTPSTDDGEKKPEALNIGELAENGTALVFRIVRSDTAAKEEVDLAVALRNAMKNFFGTEVIIVNDFDTKDDPADTKEIVVGKTNRAMNFDWPTKEDSWCIRTEGNKVFLCGESTDALGDAVRFFISENLDSAKDKNVVLEANYLKTGTYIDPEKVPDDGNPKVLFGLSQKQADEYFGDILDGLFTGETQEIIDTKTVMGKSFSMHFPDFVYVDGEYWAYYICYATENGKGGVGLAKSSDGVNYTNVGCVIQPDAEYDSAGAYFAGVWRDTDGMFYLVYECKGTEDSKYGTLENVALATSTDGINWEKQGIIIERNQTSWQTANVGTPDLYKADDTWYVYFHGFDFQTCQIGVAYGEDLHDLTMVKDPIIPTEPNTLHSGTTGRRDIIYVDGYYYMVFEISTEQPYGSAYWTHKFARSTDLINWETTEFPLVRQMTADGEPKPGMGYDGTCWCIIGKHLYVYYRQGNATYRAELVLPEKK